MRLKLILSLISIFSIAIRGFCQQTVTDFFADVKVHNAPQAYVVYNVPFKAKSITITDNRPDTIEIGLFKTMKNEDGALRPNERENLHGILNHMLASDTGSTELRLVLNHFFITTQPLVRTVNYLGAGEYHFPCMLTVNAKIYIKQQGYWQGLLRVDTSFAINTPVEKSYNTLLHKLAGHLSQRIQAAVITKSYIRHTRLTEQNIDTLNTPAIPQPLAPRDSSGLFITFADFMNGNITPANIKLAVTQQGILSIYNVEKDNTEVLVRNVWGAVKSGTTYIFRKDAFSALVKLNNAWFWKELYGYTTKGSSLLPNYAIGLATGRPATPGPWGNNNANYIYKAFMLNMQTGDGY